jgi:PAS domain S-box-containing protein
MVFPAARPLYDKTTSHPELSREWQMTDRPDELLNHRGDGKLALLRIYLITGVVMCVVGGAMTLIYIVGHRMASEHAPLVDATMETKFEATIAHLQLEEMISGDSDVSLEEVLDHIDEADWYARAMLEGGTNQEGIFVAVSDPRVRGDVLLVRDKLAELRELTRQRWNQRDNAGVGTLIYQRYDAVFNAVIEQADLVETDAQNMIARDLGRFSTGQMVLIIVCVLLTVGAGMAFGRFARNQLNYEKELIALNQQLDTSVQQLRASEQQLRAANDQLIASEQQLRTSNQQLSASEQQLRATNQQLIASEQQLRTSNQQISASEQQLRAANQQLVASEQKLRRSQEQLRDLFESANDIILLTDDQGNIVSVNPCAVRLTGYSLYELSGMNLLEDLVHEDDHARMRQEFEELRTGRDRVFDVRWLTKEAEVLHFEGSCSGRFSEKGEFVSARCILRNVTEHRKAEKSVVRERDRAQKYLDVAGTMFVVLDDTGKVTLINRRGCEVLGCSEAEVIGKDWFDTFLPKRDSQRVRKAFDELIAGKIEPVEYFENPVLTRDGQEKAIAWHNTILKDEHGRITGTLSSGADITERVLAQQALNESLQTSDDIVRAIPAGLFIYRFDPPDRLILLDGNPEAERLTGITIKDWIGKEFEQIWPSESETGIKEAFLSPLRTGLPYETEELSYKDEKLEGAFTVRTFCLPGERLAVAFENITKRKKAEKLAQDRQAQLQHVSRLSTVGEMASGLAHELNQPLSAIMSYANASLQSIRSGSSTGEQLTRSIEGVALQSKRAGEIIRRIRDFVRKREPECETVDLNHLIAEAVDFVGDDIRKNEIALELNLAPQIPAVKVDSIQIEQVLLNLVRNALEAMADSDQRNLTVSTLFGNEGLVEVTVCDSGQGLDDESANQVFDPFFTTKEDGLGIGLSISRSIIEAHGGSLWAESNAQGGSTFKFTVPTGRQESDEKIP